MTLRTALGVRYRQVSGFLAGLLEGHQTPHYSTIYRRVKDLDINKGNGMIVGTDKKLTRANDCGLDRP